MQCFGITDKGKVRSVNQDSFIIEKVVCGRVRASIVSVCDGMGGANAGEIASQLANKSFVSTVFSFLNSKYSKNSDIGSELKSACINANGVAYEYSKFDASYEGMGTTLVGGIVFENGDAHIINVGDSRCYRLSRRNKITQITKDHSLVEELVESGVISKEDARTHPQKNIVTRVLGTDATVVPDYYSLHLNHGDVLLLCSDGLSNMVSDEGIYDFYAQYPDIEKFVRALLAEALFRGASDNITIVAVSR